MYIDYGRCMTGNVYAVIGSSRKCKLELRWIVRSKWEGAVRDFVLSHEIYGRLHALVSMHTHGQLWILPYNHHKRTYPEDFRELVGPWLLSIDIDQ
ncbi:hypothetical protein ANCDUO_13270 [Ancylostoma duodenale]|uniref:Peptidase M14 carboxypeptidase A domain-containing protein n=1 Tax=Ancylostoma duodenale TaxID=51022 RepID=A0A0C2CJD1_9BILA|nr:hypothetical protein ANCDUO_13270 [Ancylostoma duodenale]